MRQRSCIQRTIRVLRHDLTLLAMVMAFVAVSAGVIAAAIRVPGPDPAPAVPVGPFEEELARAELPAPLQPVGVDLGHQAELEVLRGEIERGETLGAGLTRSGIRPETVHAVATELRPLFDFRYAQPGHRWRLVRETTGALVEFSYRTSDVEAYVVRRGEEGLVASREEADLWPEVVRIAGIVHTSLHDAVVQLGERGQLAHDFAEIFAWDVDFTRSVQPGDEFHILYERLMRADADEGEVYVRPGRILAARYNGAAGDFSAIYFEPEEGRGGYYRPDGSSVEGQFLRAPLRYSRISSRFTSARRHPILKITRPHHGIDYAAPSGTPLWAVADGKVIYRGWAGGFGNLVKIRHANGYVSYYAHLSRFAKGLEVGQNVGQKQVIGFVGQTGLATGPHVCFRMTKDGSYVDPSRIRTPTGTAVTDALRPRFHAEAGLLLSELQTSSFVQVGDAS